MIQEQLDLAITAGIQQNEEWSTYKLLISVVEMVGEFYRADPKSLHEEDWWVHIIYPISCLVIFSSSFVEDIVVGNAEIVLLVEVVDKSHSRDMMPWIYLLK